MTIFIIALAAIVALIIAITLFASMKYGAPDLTGYDAPVPTLQKPDADISDEHQRTIDDLAQHQSSQADTSVKDARARFEEFFFRDMDVPIRQVDVDGVPGEWVTPEGCDPYNRILYIHAGAFVLGSPKSHRYITAELARRTGASVLAIDYRMQPEVKTFTCHEDVRTAYRWILDNGPEGPTPSESLFVAGDSVGGNLTLAVIAWARDNRLRAADGAVAFAPLTDATMSSPTWATNLSTDHFLRPSIGRILKIPRAIRLLGSRYQMAKAPNDPEISPLLGHLGSLPPTIIQVSRDEMLFGDAVRYANKSAREGGRVTLQVWPKLVHVFQGFDYLPESSEAFDLVAEFVRDIIKRKLAQTRIG